MSPLSPTPPTGKARRSSNKNQRVAVRYRCPPATVGRIYLAEDVEFQHAWLQNLSPLGIGVIMNKPLDLGMFVNIQLKSSNSKKSYNLAAHTIHSTANPRGDWLVGFQFMVSLTSEDLEDLL